MKLKKLPILAFSFLLLLASLVFPQNSYAAISCNVTSFVTRDTGGTLQVCMSGFTSLAEINSSTATFICNRGVVAGITTFCWRGNTTVTYPLHASQEGVDYLKNQDGTYLTCIQGDGLEGQIQNLEFQLKDSTGAMTCHILDIIQGNSKNDACLNGICNTAVGNISTDINGGFLASLVRIGIGLGSGFALLLILYGIFIITTSTGIPDKMKKGQEIITSAISGLIFIILSIFLLNLIGVRILQIPGF